MRTVVALGWGVLTFAMAASCAARVERKVVTRERFSRRKVRIEVVIGPSALVVAGEAGGVDSCVARERRSRNL